MIPGTREKGAKLDLQPFIAILVDELLYLYHVGHLVYDSHTGTRFRCRARLVQAISDIRGEEKVLLVKSTPAFYGCFYCWIKGFHVCRKTVYCGHHTALPLDHPLRAPLAELSQINGHGKGREVMSTLVPAPRTHHQLTEGTGFGDLGNALPKYI